MNQAPTDLPVANARTSSQTAQIGGGRRILIADFDLFRNIGGGQSVYQKLIALRPQDTWYYFRRTEAPDAPRPANTVAVAFTPLYGAAAGKLPRDLQPLFRPYLMARNMAAAVAEECGITDFDVVDAPDYATAGLFLRQALRTEGMRVGSVVIAMHGTLSSAFRGGWPTHAGDLRALAELQISERLQFRAADARYALSDSYVREWGRHSVGGVNRLDPLCITGEAEPFRPPVSDTPPNLAFVGRREKWKGPDLFLDLAWGIDPAAYDRLLLIGPEGPNRLGQGSTAILDGIARFRRLRPEIVGSMKAAQIQELFQSRTALLLPSRHDTFNLVALEAVRLGCPALVSRRAGVAEWLKAVLPQIDWLTVDIDCSRSAAAAVADTLHNYDARRDQLIEALLRRPLIADTSTVDRIHDPAGRHNTEARHRVAEISARFESLVNLRSYRPVQRRVDQLVLRNPGLAPVRAVLKSGMGILRVRRNLRALLPKTERMKALIERRSKLSPRVFRQVIEARQHGEARQAYLNAPEVKTPDVAAKVQLISRDVPSRLSERVTLFRELARLESKRDRNPLVAATYHLRIMRWLGHDRFGQLPYVSDVLRTHGFVREAEVAEAMFAPGADTVTGCLALMQEAFARNLTKPDRELAICDDRRPTDRTAQVAVICSLYNAATKLPTLLSMLAAQSVAREGRLEIVLVDSGSPSDERRVFEAFAATHDIPIVFARSAERETIQAAWNRGIKLSRAPYLAFLGADEGLHPDALRRLAAVLDKEPEIDWVMADSVVTEVDRDGVYSHEVMTYDRKGFRKELTYLDTCYLSWVGGLYRRTIHDRFGYYDKSFRAAGDTEFKNRVLPHIQCAHLPEMLGVFNNYPEERTTASPRAEIEDLRAWYLWRTVAGMHYAFDAGPIEPAVALLRNSLNYRKSFCGHLSSDFDLAQSLVSYLQPRPDAPEWIDTARTEIDAAVNLMRVVDDPPTNRPTGPGGILGANWLFQRVRDAQRMAIEHQDVFQLPSKPHYELFNDNRYEQHWWSWSE